MDSADIVAIVAIAGSIAVGSLWVIGRTILRMMEMRKSGAGASAETAARLEGHDQELSRLRDRVAVLERLLTDDDRKLASEIERLRSAGPTAQA
jgi:phage shock protein B